MSITIVGLGPGNPRHLTLEAWEVLATASEVWLRTARHPTVSALPAHVTLHDFDSLYEAAEDFEEVYRTIARQVLSLGQRPAGVVYAVPGHPLVGESTVQHILAEAREKGVAVRIVEGLSFVEPALTALGLDALAGLQVHDGIEIAARHHPPLNPDVPALIGQVYSRAMASDLKLTLMNQYPDDHPVVLLHSLGTADQSVVHLPLYEIDRREVDHLTTLYVPPVPRPGSFEALQETVAHLRAPDGCPWDRDQSHESLRSELLEEAYEAVAAIEADDPQALCEELGDLLLEVLLHAQIATEEGEFQMIDVIAAIDAKLKRRHPHVWGNSVVQDQAALLRQWEHIKRQERSERGSLFDGIPRALPALQQAYSYGKRAARVGFDWSSPDEVLPKIREEIAEVQAARSAEETSAELGDLLFAIVNWARHLDVDPEAALRQANERFAHRFRALEALAAERGLTLGEMSIAEMDALWEEVKAQPQRGG